VSKFTAIKRNKLSAPMKWLKENSLLVGRVLDFGCGRGFDAQFLSLEAYDPHWGFDLPTGKFDTITCIYVLNVVDEFTQWGILAQIKGLLSLGGKAYVAVRRDIKENTQGRGCIQRVVKLNRPSYIRAPNFEIYEVFRGF